MTGPSFAGLAACHLRRQRALLALWRHTLEAPGPVSAEWGDWLRTRQRLLDQIDWSPTSAEATAYGEPAAGALRALRLRDVDLMANVARLEDVLLRAARAQVQTVARRLAHERRGAAWVRALARNEHGQSRTPGVSVRG